MRHVIHGKRPVRKGWSFSVAPQQVMDVQVRAPLFFYAAENLTWVENLTAVKI